ncbi:MAG: DUF4149 domain-containing protein [Candidatus Rokubacteria bacterium]|nr:DUF4149 domain-containing protein [Candidatus Rokubacteria bacterium]
MRGVYLVSVWLHILAAAVWIGGMGFLVVVLVPVLRRPEHRAAAPALICGTGVRFRWVGWISLGVLLASGTFNLAFRGIGWADVTTGRFWQGPLGIKILLVAVILLLSALHDFVVGPRAAALGQANPGAPEAVRLHRQAAWLGRFNLLLALVVVALGVMLVRGGPW